MLMSVHFTTVSSEPSTIWYTTNSKRMNEWMNIRTCRDVKQAVQRRQINRFLGKVQLHHWIALWPWASQLISLSSVFLICKLEVITESNSIGFCDDYVKLYMKRASCGSWHLIRVH